MSEYSATRSRFWGQNVTPDEACKKCGQNVTPETTQQKCGQNVTPSLHVEFVDKMWHLTQNEKNVDKMWHLGRIGKFADKMRHWTILKHLGVIGILTYFVRSHLRPNLAGKRSKTKWVNVLILASERSEWVFRQTQPILWTGHRTPPNAKFVDTLQNTDNEMKFCGQVTGDPKHKMCGQVTGDQKSNLWTGYRTPMINTTFVDRL